MFTNKVTVYRVEAINKMKLQLEHLWVISRWMDGDKVENKYTKRLRELHYIKNDELTTIASDIYKGILNMEEPVKKVKPAKQVLIPTQYDDKWNELWNMWPSVRSFTWKNTKFTCNKPFKSNEQKLKLQYVAAIENGDVTAAQINESAKKALSWCMENSYRKGRNEMEYMNGLEPWINQRQWKNWFHVDMPEQEKIHTNSTDM